MIKQSIYNEMNKLFRKFSKNKIFDFDNISYENNFIFIHIPKNAGTSIYKSLGMSVSYHKTVKEYIELLSNDVYHDMFSFAFVRNPFSRFVSLYNYARQEESYYHSAINPEKSIYGKHMDYDILKNVSIDEAAYLLKEGKLKHNPPHVQWKPQSFWLKDSQGKLNVKYIGRFEDIDFDMRNISNLIGSVAVKKIKKINTSSATTLDYRKLMNAETRTILEDYYKEDLETFNYIF